MAAPSSSSSSSSSPSPSSSSKSPPSPPPQTSHFTPIQECDLEEHDDEETPACSSDKPSATPPLPPLHKNGKKIRSQNDDASVSCNNCRPNARERISVVRPLDNINGASNHNKLASSPNGIFKSILSSLTRRSPKPETASTAAREEQWKIAVAELSHKLIQATRKRDEAVLEASRLKHSMAELEKKLNKLEQYCHSLKSGLDECTSIGNPFSVPVHHRKRREKETVDQFLVSVSEARNSIRILARSMAIQLRHMGPKVYERISILSQPHESKISSVAKNPRASLLHLEAILNKAFFEDFETSAFQRNAAWTALLDPAARRDANRESFHALRTLTWDEVLCRGTRHFSEEFSKFCDRKLSEIVATLAWNRAWPEPLLQAFFGAAKAVWLVHLLANSVQPGFEVFRIDNDVAFDAVYMEDMGVAGDKTRRLVPSVVRTMVAPGFYVCGSVVKCKVLCRYHSRIIISGATNNATNALISS